MIAVWIDSSMGAFEKEFVLGTPEDVLEIGPDEPGGRFKSDAHPGMAFSFEIKTF